MQTGFRWISYVHRFLHRIIFILKTLDFLLIKAVFSEENYFPQTQLESASMPIALYWVTKKQAEIHRLFQRRAYTNTILVKLCCDNLEYKVKVIKI